MGSLGDSDDETKPHENDTQPVLDASDSETLDFDVQSSPSSCSGEKMKDWNADAVQFLQDTLPFDDTVLLEDAFETQLVNLGGETQVLDDPDYSENISTQLLDGFDDEVVIESDGEGTDRTDILCDTEVLSDDDSVRGVGVCLPDEENVQHVSVIEQDRKGLLVEPNPLTGEQHCSEDNISTMTPLEQGVLEPQPGSMRRGFTSVRAASLRASGLAARAMTLNGAKGESLKKNAEDNKNSPIRGSSEVGEEIAQENYVGEYGGKGKELRNEIKSRVSRSTVRKLFTEDAVAENKVSTNDINSNNDVTDLSQFLACDKKSTGLSYVDSQEPEEASQANALDFVDRFLKFNAIELDQEVEHGKITKTKLNTVSNAKGPQSLVKASNRRSAVGQKGIFEWDDNREDEGGGEFFCQRKEELFDHKRHGRRSFSEPRKTQHVNLKGSRVDDISDKEQLKVGNKKNDNIFQAAEMQTKKDLMTELNGQLNVDSSGGQFETAGPDMLDVGFDTQMAAEAMEALFHGPSLDNGELNETYHDAHNLKGPPKRERKNAVCSKGDSLQKKSFPLDSRVVTRQPKKLKGTGTMLSKESSGHAHPKNVRKQINKEPVKGKPKRTKLNSEERFASIGVDNLGKIPSRVTRKRKVEGALERIHVDEDEGCHGLATTLKEQGLKEELGTYTPVACRTRQRMVANQFERAGNGSSVSGQEIKNLTKSGSLKRKRRAADTCEVSNDKEKLSTASFNGSGKLQHDKPSNHELSDLKSTAVTNGSKVDALSFPKRSRTHRNLSGQANSNANFDAPPKRFVGQEAIELSTIPRQTRSKSKARGTFAGLDVKRKTESSSHAFLLSSSLCKISRGNNDAVSGDGTLNCSSINLNGKRIPKDPAGNTASKYPEGNNDAGPASSAEGRETNAGIRETCTPSGLACTTPVNCMTPANAASPVCMGNEYVNQSCKKNLRTSLMKEINSLTDSGPLPNSALKDLRRRREISNVRVLFSQHLDDDIMKQQKKILTRLGVSIASSISEATHFITNKFVRTRNMLEAIAYGKPVVTHLWLESCGQARCFIDEKGYILRDAKKEKELGFSMPASLARACQQPLLQGRKVLITANTKPGKEIIASLVRAVDGQAVERVGRTVLKDDKFSDDLLILSCNEDYSVCEPYLEKGAAVYSSELLLNGIVTQKLEYERHRLFADKVKRTRSTIWMKKAGNQFLPVTKPR